jgi:hypothetical protein
MFLVIHVALTQLGQVLTAQRKMRFVASAVTVNSDVGIVIVNSDVGIVIVFAALVRKDKLTWCVAWMRA